MLRIVKILLVCSVALFCLLAVLHNFLDWKGTIGAVGAVTSMATIDGGAASWQATSNSLVIWIGALFIVLSKLLAGILCVMGAVKMWQARRGDAAAFFAAKGFALAGCGVLLFMLFGGFIVVADTWFGLWQSEAMRAPVLDSAFRYAGMVALIALFVASSDGERTTQVA